MEFKYLSAKEFEALSEYQQEKYLDEKRKFEAKVAKEEAEKAGKEAAESVVAAKVGEVKTEFEQKLKEQDESHKVEITNIKDEYDKKIEKAQAEMSRAKEQIEKMRTDSLSTTIAEKLDSETAKIGFGQLKSGAKTGTIAEFEAEKAPAASMGVPAGAGREFWAQAVEIPSEYYHVRGIIPINTANSVATSIPFLQYQYGPDGNLINSVSAGALKPKFEFVPVKKSAPVVKIAGHITLQDEFFEDIPGAQQSIARQLPEALYDVEDSKILRDGLGGTEDINSIWNQAQAWAAIGSVTATSNTWDKLVSAQTLVAKNKRRATAAWISPEAYQELLINKDDENGYTYPVVMGGDNVLRVGTLPVFYHNVFAAGEGIVGDFRNGAEIWQKKAVQIRFSREHAENFTHNLVTIVIEVREALTVYYPDGFIKLNNLTTFA